MRTPWRPFVGREIARARASSTGRGNPVQQVRRSLGAARVMQVQGAGYLCPQDYAAMGCDARLDFSRHFPSGYFGFWRRLGAPPREG